jgi:hypothetical protein
MRVLILLALWSSPALATDWPDPYANPAPQPNRYEELDRQHDEYQRRLKDAETEARLKAIEDEQRRQQLLNKELCPSCPMIIQ